MSYYKRFTKLPSNQRILWIDNHLTMEPEYAKKLSSPNVNIDYTDSAYAFKSLREHKYDMVIAEIKTFEEAFAFSPGSCAHVSLSDYLKLYAKGVPLYTYKKDLPLAPFTHEDLTFQGAQ
ncbi:hypothetical protein KY330_04005 [Candidatus Woesearchaeota archaeon]|nr:hypothetical protein [Candidatus Woesearchaeota archaeon]